MINEKIKIGLIGLGAISEKHIQSIKKIEGLELSAVCDLDIKKIEKIRKFGSFKEYTSYLEMLKNPELDIISICTPSGTHTELATLAAKHKKNIVLEKPIALSSKDANKIIDATTKNKVLLFVVKQNRFNPPVQHLKTAISRNRFGKIYLTSINVFWNRSTDYYKSTPWRGTLAMDGGMLLNQAAHHLDMLIWLVGMPKSVFAYTSTLKQDIESEDTACAVMKFKDNSLATIQSTTNTFRKNYEGSITILGENGTVKIGGSCMNEIEKWDFSDNDSSDDLIAKFSIVPPDIFAFSHIKVYENVLLSLKAGNKVAVDGPEAMKTVLLAEAIYESARTRKETCLAS